MSTYLYTSNDSENDKICFSYVPSVDSVRYKVNNENGKISVEPGLRITKDNIYNESIYHKPEVKGSERLLILLNKLNEKGNKLAEDYEDIWGWLISYVENLDDTQIIPEKFDKERVKGIVNDAIQQINSMDDNLFNNYKDNNSVIAILDNILHPNSSSSSGGGFNITRRLFGKRSSIRSSKRSDQCRSFKKSRSTQRPRSFRKRRSTRRR
jgi:hypothetical protein